MAMSIRLREAKGLLSVNKVAEANSLIDTVICSLLDAGKLRQAARANLVFLGRLATRTPQDQEHAARELHCIAEHTATASGCA
jgi:hypothetical protein